MHAHERTLLARLGFADPDRSDPLHDQASRYLTTKPVSTSVVAMLGLECKQRSERFRDGDIDTQYITDRTVKGIHALCEFEISKGNGQYRTTIGFVDVALRIKFEERCTNILTRQSGTIGQDKPWESTKDGFRVFDDYAAIEVKTNPVSVGDIVRQLNLYRSYSTIEYWILATTFQLNQSQVDYLKNEKIKHVYLGQRFQDFVKEQANSPFSKSLEV